MRTCKTCLYTRAICLLLAASLIAPSGDIVWALAPPSGFSKPSAADEELDRLRASEEFQQRSAAVLSAWLEDAPGFLFLRIRSGDSRYSTKKDRLFDMDYQVHPLGSDRMYLHCKILRGPLKDKACYLLVSKADKTAVLLDAKGMNTAIQLLSPFKESPLLAGALEEYRRAAALLDLRLPQGRAKRIGRIQLASGIFRAFAQDHGLPQENWLRFMLQTGLRKLPVDAQAAVWLIADMCNLKDAGTYLDRTLPENVYGKLPIQMKVDIEAAGGKTYADLGPSLHTELAERLLAAALGEDGRGKDLVRRAMLSSVWGDETFFPIPRWVQEGNVQELFRIVLRDGNFSPADLEQLAQAGFLESHKPLFTWLKKAYDELDKEYEEWLEDLMREKEASLSDEDHRRVNEKRDAIAKEKKNRHLNLATQIHQDLRYLGGLRAALERQKGAPPVKSLRIVRNIVDPSVESLDPSILQARSEIVNMSRVIHDTKNPAGVVDSYVQMIKEKIDSLPDAPPALKTAVKEMKAACASFEKTLRTPLGLSIVSSADEARQVAQEIQVKAQQLEQKLKLMRLLAQALLGEMESVKTRLDEASLTLAGRIPDKLNQTVEVLGHFFEPGGKLREETPPAEWTDLRSVVTEDVLQRRFGQEYLKAIKLNIKTDSDLPEVLVNKNEFLDFAFGQIVRNAGQAMEDMPLNPQTGFRGELTIEVTTHGDPDWVHVHVEDTGKGISRKYISRIFQREYTRDKKGGTGIGLDEAREIVEKYSGRVRAQSVLGKRTKFTIALPTRGLIEKGMIHSREDLLAPAQLAALGTLAYLGNGGNEAVRRRADSVIGERLKTHLSQLAIAGEITSAEMEGDQIVLQVELIGEGGPRMIVMPDPLVQTYGIVHKAQKGTQSLVLYAEPKSMMQLPPNLYMRKWIVGKDAVGAGIDVTESVGKNLEKIAAKLSESRARPCQIEDLKGAVLFKPRHRSLIRDLLRAKIWMGRDVDPEDDSDFDAFWQEISQATAHGEDFECGNMVFLAKKDVEAVNGLYTGKFDFVAGADRTTDALAAAALTQIYGGEMSAQLVTKSKLRDTVTNPDLQKHFSHFTRRERTEARKYGAVKAGTPQRDLTYDTYPIDQVFSAADLVNSAELLVVAAAVKESGWVKGLEGIRIDNVTGDKTVCTLVAAKGGPVRIIEVVYQGNYLELERRIEEEPDAGRKAGLITEFARALAADGKYGRALEVLQEAEVLSLSTFDRDLQQAMFGIDLLVSFRGREDEARQVLEDIDTSRADPLGVKPMLELLKAEPGKVVVPGSHYEFIYERGTGRTALGIFDTLSGESYDVPVIAGFVDARGNRISTDQYSVHTCKVTDRPSKRDVTLHYTQKGLPDLTVTYEFYKNRPSFDVKMEVTNTTGNEIKINQWVVLSGNALTLGKRRAGLVSTIEHNLGAWTDRSTQMAVLMGFLNGETGMGKIVQRAGDPPAFKAVMDAKGVRISPHGSSGSGDLRVVVDQSPLYAVPRYAFWRALLETAVPAVSPEEIARTLPLHEQESFLTAVLMSESAGNLSAARDHFPAALRDPAMLSSLGRRQALSVEKGPDEYPDSVVLDFPQGRGKLVALFNFERQPRDLKLNFRELGLDPAKTYTVLDLWKNRQRSKAGDYRLREGFVFHRVPALGVRFLLVQEFEPAREDLEERLRARGRPASAL